MIIDRQLYTEYRIYGGLFNVVYALVPFFVIF